MQTQQQFILRPQGIKMEEETETCHEGGNRSSPAPEEPPGILQLIDQLENIVDTLLPSKCGFCSQDNCNKTGFAFYSTWNNV